MEFWTQPVIQRWPVYIVEPVYKWSPLRHNQLTVIQRWSAYTVEPDIVVNLGTQPVGCYTEVVCLYSGTCIVVTLETQPAGCYTSYTVEPVYSGHPWDTTSWLSYRDGLLVHWTLYMWLPLRHIHTSLRINLIDVIRYTSYNII